MLDKILNRLYYLLFFLTPLVMFPATSEIFEFNKMLFIYAVASVIVFFWALKMILNRKIILKKTPLDVPIMLFLGAMVLSTIFSIDIHTSLFGYYGRFNGGLLSIITYLILYYGFVANEINVRNSILSLIASSVIVILWGLPGHFNRDLTCPTFNTVLSTMSGKLDMATIKSIWTTKFNNACWSRETNVFDPASRMFSTLGQPNWFGAYLAANFFFGLYFFAKKKKEIASMILTGFYLFLNFSAILFSRSRSAMGAVAIGTLIFFSYLFFVRKTKDRSWTWIAAATAIVFVVPIILFKTGVSKIDDLLSSRRNNATKTTATAPIPVGSGITESFDIRKIVWQGAWDLGLKYPLTGTGVETFAYSYYFTRPAAHNLTTEWDFIYNKAHNEYLNYLATTGFTGLFAYLILLASFAVYAIRTLIKNDENGDPLLIVALVCAWLTTLITNSVGFSTTTINLITFLVPVFALGIGIKHEKKEEKQKTVSPYFKGFSIFILSVALVYVLFSITSYFLADIDYGQGLYYSKPQISDYQKAAYYFQSALKKRTEHVYEDKLSYSIAYLAGIASYQKNKDVAKQLVTASEYYSIKSLKESPKNVLYWKTMAKDKYLYYLVDQDVKELEDGIAALKTAESLAPTEPKIPYSLAVFYSMLYDIEKDPAKKTALLDLTVSEIDKSIALKKDFYDSYYFKGQFLKKAHKTEAAKQVFEYILKSLKPKDIPTLQQMEGL